MFGMWIVIALVVVGGQLAYRQVALKRRAAAALAATAATGLAVTAETEDAPPLPFEMFNRGHGRRVRNRMWDPKDPTASVFDYEYTVRSGAGDNRSSRTYHHTCAVLAVPFSSPNLSLDKQGFFDRIAIGFGGSDVQIGHAEFDELYRVKCNDEAFARTLLDQRFVGFLLQEGRAGEIGIELAGNHVLVATTTRVDPSEFDDLLAFGHRLIGHLPSALAERSPNQPWAPWPGQAAGAPAPAAGSPFEAPGAVIQPPQRPPHPLSPPTAGPPRSTPIE